MPTMTRRCRKPRCVRACTPSPHSRDAEPRRNPARWSLLALAASLSWSCANFEDPAYDELGDAQRCAYFVKTEASWSALEVDMVATISARRGEGGSCGEQVMSPNAIAVALSPELRCAAREQSRVLAHNRRLDHVGSEDRELVERFYDAGYEGIPRAELLHRFEWDPEQVVDAWLGDPESCRALLDREVDEIGVGLFALRGSKPYWVVTLGTRR